MSATDVRISFERSYNGDFLILQISTAFFHLCRKRSCLCAAVIPSKLVTGLFSGTSVLSFEYGATRSSRTFIIGIPSLRFTLHLQPLNSTLTLTEPDSCEARFRARAQSGLSSLRLLNRSYCFSFRHGWAYAADSTTQDASGSLQVSVHHHEAARPKECETHFVAFETSGADSLSRLTGQP